jgi:CubicO group peptidase (beta-lactamase class C family)
MSGIGLYREFFAAKPSRWIVLALSLASVLPSWLHSQPLSGAEQVEHGLEIARPGTAKASRLDLRDALAALNIPSVSVTLIDGGMLAWTHAWGAASEQTLYQAASLSKLVTAVAALRLVDLGQLKLDRNVNQDLVGWRVPDNPMTAGHPVTLRGLLSMTAGVGVAGYVGYQPGVPLPTLEQILDGAPPANSQPVRVDNIPGTRYAYSGGGYEIVQALIESKHFGSFDRALHELVFSRAGMRSSIFAQPLPIALMGRAARGHYADGRELAGGWRVVPELAAGGLWSTPTDLAKLLIEIVRAYRGEPRQVISQAVAVDMLTRQNSGPYGLGGAIAGSGESLVLMKRGQNVGYQGYMLIFPRTGQGIVVLSNSDNGTELATAIIRRAAAVYGWPALGELAD